MRRRDTPHHLKNKRTTPLTAAPGAELIAEEKVRAILNNISTANTTDATDNIERPSVSNSLKNRSLTICLGVVVRCIPSFFCSSLTST